ncbi:DgyrCDS7744 [Dimorphilus gyrociliatus]|uniref:DgyrCDS7744 n=1 Tax=Dimorphilus gyrociliatus TaxID=2664684 RepID=A0A7I8VS28_9ANNE|nr:DgyrCDS7744 [Dimorphilus gyrociliatus]
MLSFKQLDISIFLQIFLVLSTYVCNSQTTIRTWKQIGDLNIGILFPVYSSGKCISLSGRLGLGIEVVKYSIDKVNKNPKMLPNITLGFTYLDTCGGINKPVQRLLELLPNFCDDNETFGEGIIGVVGPYLSDRCIPTAGLASQYQLPILATHATSEELSDKRRFGYFSRLVPPDSFVTEAMTNVMVKFKWNYVQLFYSEGHYSENMAKSFEKNAKKRGICIAHSHRFSPEVSDEFVNVAKKLFKYKNAKIIVFLLSYFDGPNFLKEIDKLLTNEKFIFISADDHYNTEGFEHILDKGIKITYPFGEDLQLYNYLSAWKPDNNSDEQSKLLFESLAKCKFNDDCHNYNNLSETGNFGSNKLSFIQKLGDGVEVYAESLHQLISTVCPENFYNIKRLKDCVTGEKVLKFLRQQDFVASSGIHYKFNALGDVYAEYDILQFRNINTSLHLKNIGSWKQDGDILYIDEKYTLESICSKPCPPKFIWIQQELQCCWLCKECRENEILVNNVTECRKCPLFHWPDEETKSKCHPIKSEYVEWSDSLSILLIILSGFGVSMNIFVIVIYRVYKEEKIIKASSRFLSGIILFGCSLGYVTVLFFITKPSIVTCVINRIGFHMTICTIYSPLFVKTLRVYRIFKAGSKGNKRPSFFDHLETRLG